MKTKLPNLFQRAFSFLTIVCAVCCLGKTALAGSPQGDVVGKVTVGYQGWFSCAGDGAPIGGWWHYSYGATPTPASLGSTISSWPDMRQFSNVYQTGFTNFGNGQPATLFSSYDQQTVDTHFRWMAENGIDTAALQRFDPYNGNSFTIGGEGPTRNDMAVKVMNAAQAYGVKFYIMYDVSGWNSNTMSAQIEYDWTNVMVQLHVTNSPMYARQNGKPVVCIWGFGFNDANHPWDAATCASVINWFKSQGVYIIGGVPTWWRTSVSDSQSNFLSAYSAFNMISPWMVGRIGNAGDSDNFYNNPELGDQAYCNANGIDYQPCVMPGGWGSRAHGDFMWRQFYNMTRLGCQGIYISMYDEFNEGNQIACTAENASMSPIGTATNYFTLDQDGTACSSDYYLRLTGDGGRMLKGGIALTSVRPTVPILPLVVPPAPSNLVAQGGNAQVVLNWSAVTGAADALSYNIKRALVSGGSYTIIATNVGHVSYTDTGLANNTAYYYVVSAVNSLGEGAVSTEAAAVPMAAYAVNSGGAAAGSFTADANFSGGNTFSTGGGVDTSAVTNPAPQAVYQTERWGPCTYSFTNLVMGANYKVRLHFAELVFSAPGMRVFNVFINGSQVLTNFDIFAAAGANYKAVIREFTATANGSGQITVQYVNIAGKDNAKSSGIEILPINTTPPLTPTGLAAQAVSSDEISLSWAAAPNVSSYNVKRSIANGGPYTNIATGIAEAGYWDNGLVASTTYYYVISAVNGGESTNSVQASATSQVLPSPAVPSGLNATPGSAQVILNWTGSSWASGYYLERSTVSGGPYTVIATNLAGVYYTNTGLVNGTRYYFVVSATNAVGGSANSSEITVMPGTLSQAGWMASASVSDFNNPTGNAIDGSLGSRWSTGVPQANGQWFQIDMGSTNTVYQIVLDATGWPGDYPRGYQVTLSNDGVTWSGVVAAGTGNSTVTTITFALQSTRFIRITQTGSTSVNWWTITEFNVLGVAGSLPAIPTGLTAVAGDGQVALNWNASLDATGYNVKQAAANGGSYSTIATNLLLLAYTNTGLVNGTLYYFAISATNSVGESSNSVPASVRPVSLAAVPLGAVAVSGQMQFTWPTDHTGWSLQAQTNSLTAGIGTNWVALPASKTTNQITQPITSTNASVFFRLVYP